MPPVAPSLKGRALRLLAMREHSRRELERKLQRHAAEPGELSRVLDELQDKGFIDAARVAASVLHRRSPRLGAARIRQELIAKGLAPEVVRDALAAVQDTELARARAVWQKKFGNAPRPDGEDDPAARVAEAARQARFLASRGFAGDTIRRVVSGAGDLPDDDAGAAP